MASGRAARWNHHIRLVHSLKNMEIESRHGQSKRRQGIPKLHHIPDEPRAARLRWVSRLNESGLIIQKPIRQFYFAVTHQFPSSENPVVRALPHAPSANTEVMGCILG